MTHSLIIFTQDVLQHSACIRTTLRFSQCSHHVRQLVLNSRIIWLSLLVALDQPGTMYHAKQLKTAELRLWVTRLYKMMRSQALPEFPPPLPLMVQSVDRIPEQVGAPSFDHDVNDPTFMNAPNWFKVRHRVVHSVGGSGIKCYLRSRSCYLISAEVEIDGKQRKQWTLYDILTNECFPLSIVTDGNLKAIKGTNYLVETGMGSPLEAIASTRLLEWSEDIKDIEQASTQNQFRNMIVKYFSAVSFLAICADCQTLGTLKLSGNHQNIMFTVNPDTNLLEFCCELRQWHLTPTLADERPYRFIITAPGSPKPPTSALRPRNLQQEMTESTPHLCLYQGLVGTKREEQIYGASSYTHVIRFSDGAFAGEPCVVDVYGIDPSQCKQSRYPEETYQFNDKSANVTIQPQSLRIDLGHPDMFVNRLEALLLDPTCMFGGSIWRTMSSPAMAARNSNRRMNYVYKREKGLVLMDFVDRIVWSIQKHDFPDGEDTQDSSRFIVIVEDVWEYVGSKFIVEPVRSELKCYFLNSNLEVNEET